MMNYSCVSVNLKDQNKTIFETQKEACDYFNVKFGTAILNDLKEQQTSSLSLMNVVEIKTTIKKAAESAKKEKN